MKPYHWKLPAIICLIVAFVFCSSKTEAQICSVNAGVDKTICVTQQPLVLSGSIGSPQASPPVYLWTKISGPAATIVTPTALTTNVTGLTPGNYIFQLSGKCIDGLYAKDIISITVLPEPPTAVAGVDINLCFNAPVHLSANAVSAPYTGTWTVSPAGGIFSPNANDPHAIYNALPRPGVRRFTWTISNGTCNKTDVMTVTFSEPVPTVNAGPDDTLACQGSCTLMHASYEGYRPQNGLWTVVSGPNTPVFADPTSSSSKVCSLVPGNYVFRWTVSGPCVNGSDTMILHVVNIKTAPATLGDQVYTSFCEVPLVTSEVLTGDALALGDTVTWVQTGGGTIASFSPDVHHSTVIVSNLTGPFPYKFNLIHGSVSGCSVTSVYTIYRSQVITGLTDPPDQELACDVTTTTFNISYNKLNTISNSVIRRAILITGPYDSGRIEFTNSTVLGLIRTDTWTVSNLLKQGTYIYRVEYSNACGSFFKDISITVSRSPGNVNAGSDITLPCHGLNVSPVGSANNPGIYTWSQVDGPNTALLTGVHTLIPSLDGLIQGLYTIRLTNWGGNMCPVKMDDMKVTVTQVPPLNATIAADTAICAGNYQLVANTPLSTETGTWSVSPSAGLNFFPDEHTPNAYVTGLQPTEHYVFTWTVSNVCGSLSATQNVVTGLFISPPVPDAGPDLCETEGTTIIFLSGNNPVGANILWTALNTGSAVSPADQQITQVTFTGGSGEYLFEYSLGTTGCGTFRDTIRVVVKTNMRVNAGADINVCATTLPYAVTMDGSTSSFTNRNDALWTQLSGPSIATISAVSDPHAIISNLQEGIYQFELRLLPESDCEFIADTVNIIISVAPSDAIAGPDQSICNGSLNTIVNLAATPATIGVGYWQIISGPQGSTPPGFSNQNAANSTISYLTQGAYHLRWTTTNGPGCPAKTADMTINLSAIAEAGNTMAGCSVVAIQLLGNPNTNGVWSQVSGPPGATISANSGNTAMVSGLTSVFVPAIYRFRYTLPGIGGCGSSSDDMIFTNYQAPSQANAGGNKLVCSDETTVVLTGGIPSLGTGNWFFQSGPNIPIAGTANPLSNDTILNNLVTGVYIYQYRVSTTGACPATTENIQIIKQAKANAQSDLRICNDTIVGLAANTPLSGQGTWSYISGPFASAIHFSNVHSGVSSVAGLVPGVYVFRWTIDAIGTCAASYDDVQVTIDPPVSPVSIGPDRVFCQGAVTAFTIGATAVPGITYTWSPTVMLSSAAVAQPVFQGVNNAGNFIYTLKSSIGTCESFSTINISVKPTPFANIEVIDQGCAATFIASPPGNGVSNPVYTWNFGVNSSPSNASGPGPHYVDLHNAANRNIYLDIVSSDGCVNSSAIFYVPLCILPVTISSFDATWKNNLAEISWNVEHATDFSHFEIERSYDGNEFGFLYETPYLNNVEKYMYSDKTVNASVYKEVFYRLKMVDSNNRFAYSAIKKIRIQANGNPDISIWPNPFYDKINIRYNSQGLPGNLLIKIYNALGEPVVKKEFNTPRHGDVLEIGNLGMLPPGFYSLQIISDNKIIINYKIIKQSL